MRLALMMGASMLALLAVGAGPGEAESTGAVSTGDEQDRGAGRGRRCGPPPRSSPTPAVAGAELVADEASLSLPAVQAAIASARPMIAGFEDRTETEPVGGLGLGTADDH
jgi:hypothetical protein